MPVCMPAATAAPLWCLQVAKRVLAESGSVAGLGLAPPCADMQAEVQAVLQAQQAAAGGGSTARCRGGDAGHEPSVCVQPGAAAADDELHLLDQHGCLPQAHGVFTNLLTWLQQQQQPQEEGSAPNTSVRLQSAAAAAAALAPGLLAGVLQQQRGVPTVKLVSTLVYAMCCPDGPGFHSGFLLCCFIVTVGGFNKLTCQRGFVHPDTAAKCGLHMQPVC